jgi:phospholipase/carboxylesterase
MAHGEFDDVVVPERGEAARAALAAMGYPVDWHSYPMAHEVCMDEVADLNAWLVRRLGT